MPAGRCLATDGPPLIAPAGLTPASSVPDPQADAALEKALELERQRQWSAAIEAYEKALERWPDRVDFRHRLRLCESHYRLGRRYQDRSFREVLLATLAARSPGPLSTRCSIGSRSHYVDPVSLVPLLRGGLDNMEVALRDPVFLAGQRPAG